MIYLTYFNLKKVHSKKFTIAVIRNMVNPYIIHYTHTHTVQYVYIVYTHRDVKLIGSSSKNITAIRKVPCRYTYSETLVANNHVTCERKNPFLIPPGTVYKRVSLKFTAYVSVKLHRNYLILKNNCTVYSPAL